MGQVPRELTPLESALHFFGAQLRHWRTLRQLSQAAVGQRSHDSGALIGKIEKGERFPSLALTRRLDVILDTGGELERLWPSLQHERATHPAHGDRPADGGGPGAGDLGLAWSATPQATVEVVAQLWRTELDRRSVLVSAAWVASAFAEPTREWLLNRKDEVIQGWSGRHVGHSDIDALWEMCAAFTNADQRLGGGYARSTLLHYTNHVVLPMLKGSYDDTIGRELMAATARLCDLCGYMSFDSGKQGLAQRYFIQALRLAQTSGNRALGAHILADMAMQAHYLGDAAQALDLASAGLDCDSPATEARCAAWQGRAYALRGDQRACARACSMAERALDQAVSADERRWFKFYTADHMTFDMVQIASDLGRHDDVQRLAPQVLASAGCMERRRVICTTTLANSYLPSQGNSRGDIDQACDLLSQVIPSLGSLSSSRTLERVNSVRRELAAHAKHPSVQQVEDRFRSTMATVANLAYSRV
ncbi:MAG: helix-turn-helix domain-containing protein [Pseudonocardiaceae bacterium]